MKIFSNYIKFLGRRNEKEIERRVNSFLPKGDLNYLDVGCDDGAKTVGRANTIGTKKVFGLEKIISRSKIAEKAGVNINVGDLNCGWNFDSSFFSCLTATEVVEHLINLDNFFSEANRILKKNATIIVSTENLASYHNIFALLLGNQPYSGPFLSRKYAIGHRPNARYWTSKIAAQMDPHLNVMTSKSLEQLLISYGFEIIDSVGVGFYPLPPLVARIAAKIDRHHASYVIVSARKK